jgi:UDP-galactopyranose mutase
MNLRKPNGEIHAELAASTGQSIDGWVKTERHNDARKRYNFRTTTQSDSFDLVCFSHLRWNFVFQRPQHLLSRCAQGRRVFFIEEPILIDGDPTLSLRKDRGVYVVVPHLPANLTPAMTESIQKSLLNSLLSDFEIVDYICWYYTPMALGFSRHLQPLATVYDCMDELSAFKGAPPLLREREKELFSRADLVFTGGQSLYEVKRQQHKNVFAFPSSVDLKHFAQARSIAGDPADQAEIPHPRLGFFGVIDERFDIDLVAAIAELRPDWHLVMIGPVVKVDEAALPRRSNIHYLGSKTYQELPLYIAQWDVALLTFARNESTKFISPTKTPEYLAAGKPVVSTSITDVVRPYGELGLVRIADKPEDFVAAAEAALNEDCAARIAAADEFLSSMSWDKTWQEMGKLIDDVANSRQSIKKSLREHRSLRTPAFANGDVITG